MIHLRTLTPREVPLHEQRGFIEEYTLTRFEGVASRVETPAGLGEKIALVAMRPEHQQRAHRFDRQITATDRARLLRQLSTETPAAWQLVMRGEELLGLTAARAGSRAWQIGPCLATPEAEPSARRRPGATNRPARSSRCSRGESRRRRRRDGGGAGAPTVPVSYVSRVETT